MDNEDIVTAITELKTENRILWGEHNKSALEWRTSVETSLQKLNNLPCNVHTEKLRNIEETVLPNIKQRITNIEWAVISSVIIGIIAFIFKQIFKV